VKLLARKSGRLAVALWLGLLLACLAIIAQSRFTADLSAFLPSSPTPQQQLLVDQLRDGLASRLILIGVEGADAETRALVSQRMAQKLRSDPAFASISNGEESSTERDRAYLFDNRYLLSPAVTPQRFSVEGLRTAIGDSIDALASPAGLLMKTLLPRDPTGEMMHLLTGMDSGNRPQLLHGAWASLDGDTALLLAQTRATGSDTDAQQRAMASIREAFDHAAQGEAGQPALELRMTGPGVFSVLSRDAIKSQVRLIFIVSSGLIALLLLLVYRSPLALLLGLLPVATGIAAGIAAVSLGFGVVHGITLGFGTALIGEAVDYSIYLFMQAEQSTERQDWLVRVWPTIRLGVLTSVFGFAALLLSGFPGLAQLGLYSVAGLIAAALMTRHVLPHLLPHDFHIRDVSTIGSRLERFARYAARLRTGAILLLAGACVVLYAQRDHLWNHELAALSPVTAADQALDTRLRAAMGAPDVRYMVVVPANDQQAALRAAEDTAAVLQPLVDRGVLAGFESPSRYLPSLATQQARQVSLPDAAELQARVREASVDLPVKPQLFEPFVADVQATRNRSLLQREDLQGTSMALALDAMLIQQSRGWSTLMPLTAPSGSQIDAATVQEAIADSGALFIDLKTESDQLYTSYLHEAILLSLAGVAAIVLLLFAVLRSPVRVMRVILPLAAAVVTVTALLVLGGQQLIILHLIGLLLIVAIGSNYALFFDQGDSASIAPRTYASLLFANIATVLGFGLLALSSVPVLQALGVTVAPGVILALIFSAVFAVQSREQQQ
jgi:predicted exporter